MQFSLHRRRPHTRPLALVVLAATTAAVMAASVASAVPGASPSNGLNTRLSTPASADRLDAPVMLARPNGGKVNVGRNMSWGDDADNRERVCHATRPICVHWTTTGTHAPPDTDTTPANGTPDQVDSTLAAVATSWATIVGKLGFRAPLADDRSPVDGGDDRFDVYLADTGTAKLAGYTSSDDPRLDDNATYRFRDVSAFVVLDNDYRSGQFTRGTPLANLRVTAAHEFFHAVQFAYDYREDTWLKEGTATWVEDQVFDGLDLNRKFLQHSSLAAPLTPLDFGRQNHEYGAWLFFRYLSERFGPKFIATVWRLADDSPKQVSGKDMKTYSMAAIKRAINREDREFRSVFADFMRVNLRPARFYDEGASYPVPYSANVALNRRGEDTGWLGIALDHLAGIYVTFTPGVNAPPGRRLLVRIDGPPRGTGAEARVVVRFDNGRLNPQTVRLNKQGNGEVRVNFGRAEVAGVDVALINASSRYSNCFKSGTSLSCRGKAKDNGRRYNVRARVL